MFRVALCLNRPLSVPTRTIAADAGLFQPCGTGACAGSAAPRAGKSAAVDWEGQADIAHCHTDVVGDFIERLSDDVSLCVESIVEDQSRLARSNVFIGCPPCECSIYSEEPKER